MIDELRQERALLEIRIERAKQEVKWGGSGSLSDMTHEEAADERRLAILTEEVGEVAKAILEGDHSNLYDELVQVAAVAVAWLEVYE